MNLSTFCLKQREKEATAQKYLIIYALIGSSLLHLSAALGSNFLWQKKPELTEEPIEVIMVDAPKPEVKPPKPKPEEIKPKPTPIPETKIVNTPTRPITPIPKPEPPKTTIKAPPTPSRRVTAPKHLSPIVPEQPKTAPEPEPKPREPVATNSAPAPKRPTIAPPLSTSTRKNPQFEGIDNTLNRTTSTPTENSEPVMTSPGNVASNQGIPSQKPGVSGAPVQASGEDFGQLRDSFDTENSTSNSGANPSGTSEGSGTATAPGSPGNVAINQAPSKPTQESGNGGTEGGVEERSGGVRCVSNCQPDYPSNISEKVEGRPVVRIVIGEGGEVVESQLAKTSGHSQLDQAAIASSRNMVFDPPGTKVAVRVAINFTVKDSDFHQEALERERQAQQEREQKEKERQAQLERERQARERQAQLERERKEKERQAQLQQEQRQEALERERERVQQQRQRRIEQESRRQEIQRQQQMEQQIPGQENQPPKPQPRLPSVFDEKP